MTSMTHNGPEITGGVDTHGLTHHAAVIDSVGRHLADREFPATIRGYRDLLDWMRSHGALTAVGVEGTGAYGAELARVRTRERTTTTEPSPGSRRLISPRHPEWYVCGFRTRPSRAAGCSRFGRLRRLPTRSWNSVTGWSARASSGW